MDNKRFDDLTRGLAQGVSRRNALKLFVAAIAGIGVSNILKFDGEELSIGTHTAAAQFSCADDNIVSLPCDQYDDYLRECGVKCPHGKRLKAGDPIPGKAGFVYTGEGCASSPNKGGISNNIVYENLEPKKIKPIYDPGRDEWCVDSQTITWRMDWILPPEYAVVRFTPTDDSPCCGDECKNQFQLRQEQVEVHEQGHLDIYQAALDYYNNQIQVENVTTGRLCGSSGQEAVAAYNFVVKRLQDSYKNQFLTAIRIEPFLAPLSIDCSACKDPGIDQVCCNGHCIAENQCFGCENCGASQCCDRATNTCVDRCPDCQTCQSGTCVDVDCGDPCLECRNNSCQPKCDACSTCNNGICTSSCVGCMHCENGLCVRTCTDNESCCGTRCYNGSEFRPCGPANDGCYLCSANLECCASNRTCCDTTVSRCCGDRGCVPYGPDNCGDCRRCNDGQVCCIGDQGQIYGCADDENNCP